MLKYHWISPGSKLLTGVFILCILLVVSCSTAPAASTPTPTIQVLPATLTTTTSQTETSESLPPTKLSDSGSGTSQILLIDKKGWPKEGFPTDVAKIIAITLERNILKINVTYQGGCQEHTFGLHAETAFLMSNPPQWSLYLSHDAHGDTCTENVEKLLSFDLTPMDKDRAERHAHPLLLRIIEPVGGSFADEPYMPLIEWP